MKPVDFVREAIENRELILCIKLHCKRKARITIAWFLLIIIAFILGGEYGEIEVKIEDPE